MSERSRHDTTLSVIVPTLDEAARLPALLAGIAAQDQPAEILVVDGGSTDGSLAIARAGGARTLATEPGRGQQLAAGAAAASGDILLFLHADSTLPRGALARIRETLTEQPDLVGGNFELLFDGDDGFSRWLNGFYRWIRRRGFYYGDSAVFVRREAYRALGGIRPIALMEDYDFNRRMERFGRTCCIGDPPMITSSRRFRGRHPVAIVWGWVRIHLLYYLGVSPARLARIYDSARRRQRPNPRPQPETAQDAPPRALSDQS